jgi:hypothetical protein
MPSRALPYPLFDADNHLYETQDAMTRYLPREYRPRSWAATWPA